MRFGQIKKAAGKFSLLPFFVCRFGGIRTLGPLIKSQLLYQLSYEPNAATKVTDCFSFSKKQFIKSAKTFDA